MKKYIGITIGPIVETISEASSPAALWFASSMFSNITKRLCGEIKAAFLDAEIYSPFYSETDNAKDGVGKYHDRIFFSVDENTFSNETLKQIVTKVKRETATVFPFEEAQTANYFDSYLQIHFIVADESQVGDENCILVLSPYLDALELMKTFPKNDEGNPVKRLFKGKKEEDGKQNKNAYIKESALFTEIEKTENQFINAAEKRIYTIEEIAGCKGMADKEYKRSHYYAMVSADADRMGKVLETLKGSEITRFSEACLNYDVAAAKMIGEFGGMTIYAGGDDLLFLAPVMNAKGELVLDLCRQINKKFAEVLQEHLQLSEDRIPTLSFGISIQYHKFPLYEALEKSRSLLDEAKRNGRNAMMLQVQKHSGQSISLFIGNEAYEVCETFVKTKERLTDGKAVQSALYILRSFKELITVLNKNQTPDGYPSYESAWLNFFDNAGQKTAESYIKKLCKQYYDAFVMGKTRIQVPAECMQETGVQDESLYVLLYILQFAKFLDERGKVES